MIIYLLVLAGIFLGLSYICLGTKKHQVAFEPNRSLHKNNTKAFIVGATLLLICLVLSMVKSGVGVGFVYYFGSFSMAQLLVILLVQYTPKKLAYGTGFYFFLK